VIAFRPFVAADLDRLSEWLARDHVAAWWGGPYDMAAVVACYGPRLATDHPVRMYVIEIAGRALGKIQRCPADRIAGCGPEVVGIDLFIADVDAIGRGLGPRIIDAFVRDIVFADPAVRAVVADPDSRNVRSIRAFEKAASRSSRVSWMATGRRLSCGGIDNVS
jgi:aminoglycoside 6'-N-acetyltransferase